MQLSPPSRHFIPLWSKYSPQHPVLKHPQFICTLLKIVFYTSIGFLPTNVSRVLNRNNWQTSCGCLSMISVFHLPFFSALRFTATTKVWDGNTNGCRSRKNLKFAPSNNIAWSLSFNQWRLHKIFNSSTSQEKLERSPNNVACFSGKRNIIFLLFQNILRSILHVRLCTNDIS
jgi:hypothetical protein